MQTIARITQGNFSTSAKIFLQQSKIKIFFNRCKMLDGKNFNRNEIQEFCQNVFTSKSVELGTEVIEELFNKRHDVNANCGQTE